MKSVETKRLTTICCCTAIPAMKMESTVLLSMEWFIRQIRAVFFADEQAFNWIQKKLGLSNYQMAALIWLKGLILGLLLGWWLL